MMLLAALLFFLVSAAAASSSSSSFSQHIHIQIQMQKQMLCSSSLYPDVCIQSLLNSSTMAMRNPREVISIATRFALRRVNLASNLSSRLAKQEVKGGRFIETKAIEDCQELMDDVRDLLSESISALSSLPTTEKLQAIKVQLSSSLSLQTACSDGLSTFQPGIRSKLLLSEQISVSKVIVNCLSLAKTLLPLPLSLSTWAAGEKESKVKEGDVEVVVAQDGSGQYITLQGAVDAIPKSYSGRYIILIKEGVYQENVIIAKMYKNLMLLGDGINRTIITANRNVALQNYTTYRSATLAVSAPGFIAKGITFQNTAGPEGHQAVAIRVSGDFTVFENCSFEGYQDTLYALAGRQFYRNCDIYGTVDYIFGNAIAVFQNCNLYARRPLKGQQNTYTAQGRTVVDDPSGYSFINCSLLPADDLASSSYSVATYLGRPWKAYSRTVFLRSYMDALINKAGWLSWNSSNPYTDSVYYGEYQNRGLGSTLSQRVTWSGLHSNMSFNEAFQFSPNNFISASTWLPQMGVTYEDLSS